MDFKKEVKKKKEWFQIGYKIFAEFYRAVVSARTNLSRSTKGLFKNAEKKEFSIRVAMCKNICTHHS